MRGGRPWRLAGLIGITVAVVVLAGCGATTPAASSATATPIPLPTLDPSRVARGRQVYVQNCARCHGVNAEGAPSWQKTDARGDVPPPPHDDTGHTWRHGDAELTEIIRDGLRDRFNKTPELTMPPFKDSLTDEEIAAVIEYFKSLWSPEHRRYQEDQNANSAMPTPRSGQ